MAGKITNRAISALKVPAAGEAYIWDGEMRGFGVRAGGTGTKTFVLQYRTLQGRSRRLTLGRVGVLTTEQARNEAREKLVEVTRGHDPAQARRLARADITVGEVCDWYLSEGESGRLLGRRNRPIKASTLCMDRSRIEQHIKPLIGNLLVTSLCLGDIEALQADIASGRTARARLNKRGATTSGGDGVASRTVSTLHSLFQHAVRLGVLTVNPARGVRKLAIEPRDRRLSTEELEKLGAAMRGAIEHSEHPVGLAAIRLLALTGFRRQEGVGLQRKWVDPKLSIVRFPDTKSGKQVRVLGHAALAVVQRQPVNKQSPFVFPADWGDGHFTSVAAVLARISTDAGLTGVTPHVLRHTFASIAGELGFSELTIAALLGHAARGITHRLRAPGRGREACSRPRFGSHCRASGRRNSHRVSARKERPEAAQTRATQDAEKRLL